MEYIRRFCKFLSEQQCNHLDCINSEKGFKKCADTSSHSIEKPSSNCDDLNKSIHKDISDQENIDLEESDDYNVQELLEPEETSDISGSIDKNIFVEDYLEQRVF